MKTAKSAPRGTEDMDYEEYVPGLRGNQIFYSLILSQWRLSSVKNFAFH